ncbi:membrane protein insertion efficiency factor YidD [Granulicella cerasi]|uniref:membrane protein insertion efficiency factor YidD n=1 Tax=Granulicella cerasi TaxID=741063 RepID=UPI0021E00638|nr:membrane protein insertion efficiency factor YidD [Granulicella cerasi]
MDADGINPAAVPPPLGAPTRRERFAGALFTTYKRTLSPTLAAFGSSGCRYLPTCSEYAYAAVVKHGWTKGSWLAARRLARCHPFCEGGHDPVP